MIKSGICAGGGRCEKCGLCSLYPSTARKEKLTDDLPKGFTPDLEIPGASGQEQYGIAYDIGTTTVVGVLWDLKTGTMKGTIAATNPQSRYGADVISRIMYGMQSDENRKTLQTEIVRCCNEMIREFAVKNGIIPQHIVRVAVVGNTTMGHLFLGVDASSLAMAPFTPGYTGLTIEEAGDLGLEILSEAKVYLLPNIAGHVGSDIVGVLLASGLKQRDGLTLAIDIGTNGEIVLAKNGRMLTCSTAAGPAFEGAGIYQGMRASRGAVEGVEIESGEVRIQVIGDCEPVGICGSGLIDAVAGMLDAGMITYKGNLITAAEAAEKSIQPELVQRLRKGANGNEFVLVWKPHGEDLVINQKDIREVQLAKGAIYGGTAVLIHCMGEEQGIPDNILIAGAFGNYISKKSALRIGLLPAVEENRIEMIGNAAGVGSSMALLSKQARVEATALALETEHIALALHPDFEKEYLQAMYFPKERQ